MRAGKYCAGTVDSLAIMISFRCEPRIGYPRSTTDYDAVMDILGRREYTSAEMDSILSERWLTVTVVETIEREQRPVFKRCE